MTHWQVRPLGDVIELQRGYDLTEAERTPGCVPVIGSAGQNGWHDRARAEGPGVTVGRSGASIGAVTFTKEDYWPHNTVLYVKDFKGNEPAFVAMLLQGLNLAALNSGSAQPSLNRNFVYPIEVRLPSPPLQRRIASFLSVYDDLIEVNQRRIVILEDMARRLFDEWFVRFRYPGHEAVPLVETEIGVVPEEWTPVRLGSLLTLSYGKALKADQRRAGPVPVFGSSGIVGEHDQHLVRGPGIIVGRKGNVGSVHWSSHDFHPIDTVFFVETNMPLRWIYQLLKRQTFLNSDAAVPGLNREQAYAMKVLRPGPEPVGRYSQLVEPLFQQVELLTVQNSKLRAARDLLLPKLISGEIDVSTAREGFAEAAE